MFPPRRATTTQVGVIFDNRYAVRGLVGEGAMARVYAAEDLDTGGVVAVKVLEPQHLERAGGLEQFLAEARAAERVRHPNVVTVHSVGRRGDGRPYIVMELLEGEALGAFLEREERLPLGGAVAVCAALADALAAAHAAGVVHRDVKPGNVFLVGELGRPRAAKLLDFGLAQLEQSNASEFESGMAVGTTTYMAPEQVLAEPIDGRADVYGLGVLLFKMLTGHAPFEGTDDALVLAHQLFSPAPPPSWLDPLIPEAVDRVVLGMLRKHPDNRYASMADVARDLRLALGADAHAVAPPPLGRTPDRFTPQGELGAEVAQALEQEYGRPSMLPPLA
jgi:serine/threonine protein kinase